MTYQKRILAALIAPAFVVAASAVQADVFVRADIHKTKDVDVDEYIDIYKFAFFVTFDFLNVDAVAEQDVIKNQRNQFNFVEDENADALASIDSSVATASGIVLINQSPGFINNQGNEVSVSTATSLGSTGYRPVPSAETTSSRPVLLTVFDTDGDGIGDVTRRADCATCDDDLPGVPIGTFETGVDEPTTTPLNIRTAESAEVSEWAEAESGGFAHAQVSVQQINGWDPSTRTPENNEISQVPTVFGNEYVNVFGATLTDDITGSFIDGSGIAGVNQAAGSLNNQNNALSIAVAEPAVYALGESNLGQFNTYNTVDVIDQLRTDQITGGSFDGFAGVAMVNQSSGSINNQANVVDIATTNQLSVSVELPFAQ
ncbi:hypothetical protein KJ059_06820 [Myxococcota bacterium]|nr:hypothetical protein [Myxococcota bacterium]MCZ7620254.1 hypothetical protein [Myxococcota bacterium]